VLVPEVTPRRSLCLPVAFPLVCRVGALAVLPDLGPALAVLLALESAAPADPRGRLDSVAVALAFRAVDSPADHLAAPLADYQAVSLAARLIVADSPEGDLAVASQVAASAAPRAAVHRVPQAATTTTNHLMVTPITRHSTATEARMVSTLSAAVAHLLDLAFLQLAQA